MRNLSFKTPHIAMSISGLTNEERLTICATDEQGRHFYGRSWSWRAGESHSTEPGIIHYLDAKIIYNGGPLSFQLDLPKDVKTVDLTFCIHYPIVTEFVFKPPGQK
jgi:hypothetical protein